MSRSESVNYNTDPAQAREARQREHGRKLIGADIKDTYTFLINYLLLSQLRHAASELLLLLLPAAVHPVLRRLTSRIIIGSARRSTRLASASKASITRPGILTTKA